MTRSQRIFIRLLSLVALIGPQTKQQRQWPGIFRNSVLNFPGFQRISVFVQ